jgi:hypothetical protein
VPAVWAITKRAWQDDIVRLAESARWLILFPSYHPGTMWETRMILQNPEALEKTLWVMLPEGRFMSGESWEETRKVLAPWMELPPFDAEGQWFSVSAQRKTRNAETLPGWLRNRGLPGETPYKALGRIVGSESAPPTRRGVVKYVRPTESSD